MTVYDNVKLICEEKELSIRKLERAVGFGNGTIRRWRDVNPRINNVKAVADALEVPMEKLLKGVR